MKIILSENQLKNLREQKIVGYAPEKINEFVVEGLRYVEKLKKLYQKYYDNLLLIHIGDIFEHPEKYKNILNDIEKIENFADNLIDKYYTIVEMYEIGEYPDNVRKLDDIHNEIDNLKFEMGQVKDVYKETYDSVEHFMTWNQSKIKSEEDHNNLMKQFKLK